MSRWLKGMYFIVLLCVAAFFIYRAQDDNVYTFSGDTFTYNEETSTLLGPYVSLWGGDYTIQLKYQSESDRMMTISTDRNISEDVLLDEGENLYERQVSTGRTDLFRLAIPNCGADDVIVNCFTVSSDRLLFTDNYFFAIMVIFLGSGLFLIVNSKKWKVISREQKVIGFILIAVTIFACYPFFTTEFVEGWDTWGHLLRLESVKDALYQKQIPVSVFPNNCNGFGQLGAMYPLLLLYPFGVLRGLHISLIVCYKLMFMTATAASVLTMYYSMKTIIKSDYAALIAASLYCIAPYRMEDIYCRHALGEILAMIFVPLVIAGLYHIFVGDSKKYWPLLVFGYSGVMQSHIISFVLAAFMSLLIGLLFMKRLTDKARLMNLMKALGLTILLNIWYIVPFITHLFYGTSNGVISNSDFAGDATKFAELLSKVRYGAGGEQGIIGMIGIACILCIVICMFSIMRNDHQAVNDKFIFTIFVVSVVFVFMVTTYFPWNVITQFKLASNILGMIQFPFRLLVIAIPILYMVLGYALERVRIAKKYKYIIFVLLFSITVLGIKDYMYETWKGTGEKNKMTGGITNIAIPENYPQGADEASCQNESWYPYSYEMNIANFYRYGSIMTFDYVTPNDGEYVDFPRYYFIGYSAKVIGGELSKNTQLLTEQGAEYRIRVHLPKSEQGTSVKINYTGTWYFKIAYSISVTTLLFCIYFFLYKKRIAVSGKRG